MVQQLLWLKVHIPKLIKNTGQDRIGNLRALRGKAVKSLPNRLDFEFDEECLSGKLIKIPGRDLSGKLATQRGIHLQKPRSYFHRSFIALFLLLTSSAVTQSVPPQLMSGLKWRLIGPFRGGRVVTVAGVPGDSKYRKIKISCWA